MPKKKTGGKPVTKKVSLADITTNTKEATDAGNVSIPAARISGWSPLVPLVLLMFFPRGSCK